MKKYLFVIPFVLLIPISVFAFSSPTGYQPYGKNMAGWTINSLYPDDLGTEAQWNIPADNGHARCFSYAGLGNHTIASIQGDLSSITQNIPKSAYSQVVITMWLSPLQSQSQNDGLQTTTSDCHESNGSTNFESDMYNNGGYKIAQLIEKMTQTNSSTIFFNFQNMNQTVPAHWYLTVVYGASTSASSSSWIDSEIQGSVYLSK